MKVLSIWANVVSVAEQKEQPEKSSSSAKNVGVWYVVVATDPINQNMKREKHEKS